MCFFIIFSMFGRSSSVSKWLSNILSFAKIFGMKFSWVYRSTIVSFSFVRPFMAPSISIQIPQQRTIFETKTKQKRALFQCKSTRKCVDIQHWRFKILVPFAIPRLGIFHATFQAQISIPSSELVWFLNGKYRSFNPRTS